MTHLQPSSRANGYILAIVVCIGMGFSPTSAVGQDYRRDGFDVNRVIGFEQCQKCHVRQVAVLRQHPHFVSGSQIHRRPDAKAMAKTLGYSSVKRSDLCMSCHYTPQGNGQRLKAVSGISCESCHGPAEQWQQIHNNFGGLNVTRDEETPDHRQWRWNTAIERGMNPPVQVYALARACVRCHVIKDERLVNEAGHPSLSEGFEFVAWSQGNVRHNFLRSNDRGNPPSDVARQRIMFVTGKLAELEASLRAAAKATSASTFGVSHARRALALRQLIAQLADSTGHPLLQQAASVATQAKLKIGNSTNLESAADSIGRIGWQMATADSDSLASVDSLLPSPSEYIGRPVESVP